jgi:lipopolysaccharide transport system ATP-binding protein
MSDVSIRVEGLGKWYRLGQRGIGGKSSHFNLAMQKISEPFRKFEKNHKSKLERTSNGRDQFIWALKDVSFEVHRGEVLGLIGPNGAGKSTLLKILTRITTPTTGTVDIYGRVSSLLEVGTGFHRELSGRDNVYLNGSILGLTRREIQKRFDEIVAFAEMEKHIDTMAKYYSSGMAVRLAFAIAAHLEPDILLVDEVLAVGDANFQKKSLAKMESVGQSGRTILFVSHHLPSITRLCENALLLNHGKMVERGPAEDVVAHYLSSNLGIDAYREWIDPYTAPGDDVVRLRSARVIDEEGETRYNLDIRQPVGIEIEYDVLRPGFTLSPSLSFVNAKDIVLFTSSDTEEEWQQRRRPEGRYRSVAWIPGNFLAEGDIRVSLSMCATDAYRPEHSQTAHFENIEAVGFQIIDNPELEGETARVDNQGRIYGSIRPYLRWDTILEGVYTGN